MDYKGQWATRYFVTSGWMIVAVILIIVGLYLFGVFEFVADSQHNCQLSDGFSCINYFAETDKELSTGDEQDTITLIIKNTLPHEVYNFSIRLTHCNDNKIVSYFEEGGTINFTLFNCKNLMPDKTFRSKLDLFYVTEGSISRKHYDQGFLSVYVDGPVHIKEKNKSPFALWIKRNIG